MTCNLRMHWESYKMIRSSQLILYDFMYDKVSDKDWYNHEIAGILWGIQSSLPFQRSPFSRIPGAVAGAPGTTALKEAASSHRISRRNPEFFDALWPNELWLEISWNWDLWYLMICYTILTIQYFYNTYTIPLYLQEMGGVTTGHQRFHPAMGCHVKSAPGRLMGCHVAKYWVAGSSCAPSLGVVTNFLCYPLNMYRDANISVYILCVCIYIYINMIDR